MAKALVYGTTSDNEYRHAVTDNYDHVEVSRSLSKDHSLVVFTGGCDIHPGFYDEDSVWNGYFNPARDAEEMRVYMKAKEWGIPCLGICRGAQLLNVCNGGKLFQHVTNHTSNHFITAVDHSGKGDTFEVNSTHHQMMYPAQHAKFLAWAAGLSSSYVGLNFELPKTQGGQFLEPEVLFYKDTLDLCVQFHPERYPTHHPVRKYVNSLVSHFL